MADTNGLTNPELHLLSGINIQDRAIKILDSYSLTIVKTLTQVKRIETRHGPNKRSTLYTLGNQGIN